MSKMNKYNKLTPLIVCLWCFNALPFNAIALNNTEKTNQFNVQLVLKDIKWTLAVDNQLLTPLEAEILPHEKGFARQIQPLLANKSYQKIIGLFKNRPIENDSEALLLLRGQVLLLLGDLTDAERVFTAALQKMPDLMKAHQGLSLLYMQQQQYKKAQQHLIRSIELGYADDQVYAQLAFIHVKNNQPWSAIAAYRQALMLAPEQHQYQQGLLFALISADDLSQATVLLNELINKTPDNAQLWLQRGQIALQQSEKAQALINIEVALKLNPNDMNNQLLAAQLHLTQGSSERAVYLVQQTVKQQIQQNLLQIKNSSADALNKNPKVNTIKDKSKIAQVTLQTLAWLVTRQQWNLASGLIEEFEPLLRPSSNVLLIDKFFTKDQAAQFSVYAAQLSLEKGYIKQAMASLQKAINVNPNLGDALLSLANLYNQQQQFAQARLMYVRAQALPKYQLSAWLGLAQIEIDTNNYKAALVLLKKALRAEPTREDLSVNIRALQKLVRHES